MPDIKVNLLPQFTGYTDQDRLVGYPAAAFSTADGPAADALARAHTPAYITIASLKSFQGAWQSATGARAGHLYSHQGTVWLCLQQTSTPPARGSASWYRISDEGTWRGDWVTATDYKRAEVVRQGGEFYRCTTDHRSDGSFAQDVARDHWRFDTLPSHMTAESDALGINIAPDAVFHAFSYNGHTHGESVIKVERYGDDPAYVEVATDGEERARVGYDPTARAAVLDTASGWQFRHASGANYVNSFYMSSAGFQPATDANKLLGAPTHRWRSVYARHMTAAMLFDSPNDLVTENAAPDGQIALLGTDVYVRRNAQWVDTTPTPHDTLISLSDTPAVYGTPGSRLVVGRDRAGFAYESGPIPPEVRDGWERVSARDFSPNSISDATNFLQVDAEDGVGLWVGERYIPAPSGVVIPPYSGETSPDVRAYNFAATASPTSSSQTVINVSPRYHHGSSEGTLGEFQRAGAAKVTWGGIEYRVLAYYDPHNTSRRSYFAFSQSQVFNSPSFGNDSAGDRIFHLPPSSDELYSIAAPPTDESHLEDYELYALVRNRILRIRFNNDPDASSLLTSDVDTEPQVTTVAEFTRHADQEDVAARKYHVGDLYDGNRSRGLTWHGNVLFHASNLGIFAIDSYTGERIPELDTSWNDVGGYPSGLDNQSMDVAGVAWYGDYLYVLYHEHHDSDRAHDSHIRAYRWQGDPIARFATRVATGATGLPTAQQGVLPDWVVLDDTEQSLGAPALETAIIRDPGPASSNPDGYDNLGLSTTPSQTIGQGYDKTVAVRALFSKPLIPAGQGQIDIGHPTLHSWRTVYTENVRVRTIRPRVDYDADNPGTTGLRITDITEATGNLESVRVFSTLGDALLGIPTPISGQVRYITDPAHRVTELWDGTQWVGVGGEHAGSHSDLSQVATDVVPLTDNLYDLGRGGTTANPSNNRRWAEVHAVNVYAERIAAGPTATQGALRIGRADGSGLVVAVSRWNFDAADVRHVATSITGNVSTTTGTIAISLIDDGGTSGSWRPTFNLTPAYLATGIGHIQHGTAGQVLALGDNAQAEWADTAGGITVDQITTSTDPNLGSLRVRLTSGAPDNNIVAETTVAPALIWSALTRLSELAHPHEIRASRFRSNSPSTYAHPIPHVDFGPDGNDNTGIIFPGTNQVGVATGGEEAWRFNGRHFVPNPGNVLNNVDPVGVIGEDTTHHRFDAFAGTVNYQALVQASDRARKFNITDYAAADSDDIMDIRVRRFRFDARPERQVVGAVLEELPANWKGTVDGGIDLNTLVFSLVAELQQVKRDIDKMAELWSTFRNNRPGRRAWPADTAATRGTPPPGWNADGTRTGG